jgi:hypothetical protein
LYLIWLDQRHQTLRSRHRGQGGKKIFYHPPNVARGYTAGDWCY